MFEFKIHTVLLKVGLIHRRLLVPTVNSIILLANAKWKNELPRTDYHNNTKLCEK